MKQSLSSLQIDVARKLTALMHGGRWRVGDRISDLHLADELKVSRTPVRQALMLLTAQGLVAYHPGRAFGSNACPMAMMRWSSWCPLLRPRRCTARS